MNNADHAIRIDLLAKTKGVASAENYFENLHESSKTKKTHGALLNCYCKEKMLDKAVELFEKMKSLDCTSTLNYNTVMTLYLSTGQPEKVILLAEEMEAKNIALDLYTYNQLMNSHALLKDLDSVERVLEKMETKKVKCGWFTYGNLATIYVNSGLVEKANSALAEMMKMGNVRDREAFHTLITLYGKTSNLSGVNRAWESLKNVFPKPSNVSYLIMLLALSKLGDLDALEKCFREWESRFSKESSNYDVRVSNVILESYVKRGMIEEADSIYESISKNGAEPNLKTNELFVNFHIKKREMDLALKYLEMGVSKVNSEKHSWFPTDETVRMFLKYFEEENDVEKAEKFCESMKKIGRLDPTVYDSLLCTNIAAGKVVPQIFQGVKEEIILETKELLSEK